MVRKIFSIRSDRGASLVELAIIIFLLLLLVITFVEMGIAIRRSNVVIEASRAGARAAGARSGQDIVDYCTEVMPAQILSNLCSETPLATSSASALSGFRGTCNFFQSENADLSQWRVIIDTEERFEGGQRFPFFRLTVEQSDPSKKNCLICIGGVMNDFRLRAVSSFAVQRRCS